VDKLLNPELFRVLGEPTRAKVLGCLIKCGRGCSVTEVAECCSIDFSVVARHLSTLARAGVLESRKEGRKVIYMAQAAGLSARLRDLADAIDEWEPLEECGGDDCCTK
jgi:ArsR family transcriptional regulator